MYVYHTDRNGKVNLGWVREFLYSKLLYLTVLSFSSRCTGTRLQNNVPVYLQPVPVCGIYVH